MVNNPEQTIEWANGELLGISEFIPPPQTERPRPVREIKEEPENEPATVFDEPEYEGPPIEVEGSTEYLRLILPSTEHPGYKQVLRLMREWSFLRDRNHSHWWWLRDSSKVLDFLATHQKELELDHEAEFTDNFRNLTSGIKRAELRASATETGDGAEVEVRIVAGGVPPTNSTMPSPRDRTMSVMVKKYICSPASYARKLRNSKNASRGTQMPSSYSRASHRVEKFQAPSMEDFLLEADPRFQPPAQWKKRSAALRDLSALPAPSLDESLESILRPYQKIRHSLAPSPLSQRTRRHPRRRDGTREKPSRPSAC